MGMRGAQEVKIIGQEYLNGELVPKFSLPFIIQAQGKGEAK